MLELFITILTISFGLTASFKDPGIVTMKTNLYLDEENDIIPQGVIQGQDFFQT